MKPEQPGAVDGRFDAPGRSVTWCMMLALCLRRAPNPEDLMTNAYTPAEGPIYLNLRQLAARTGLSIHSLRHWIYDGRLTHEKGLRLANGRWLVEWSIFKAALDAGRF